MKKRLLSILLTACLLVGLLPTVALAEGTAEQFKLTPGGTYWFDLSGENIPGTVNTGNSYGAVSVPDTTLHYVPFTYAGTVDAYKLTSEMVTTEDYATQNKYPHSLFVADYAVTHTVSWDELNNAGLIFGKSYTGGSVAYTLRAPSVGSWFTGSGDSARGTPQSNEWDMMLGKNEDYIKNWNYMGSWGQDTSSKYSDHCATRGYNSARYWYYPTPFTQSEPLGFRPVLEVLNADTLGSDGLKAVTLDLNGGKLGGSADDIQIIVKNGAVFTAPASDGLTRPDGDTGDYFKWLGSDGNLYAPGDSVPADVTTLTAQWTPAEQFNLTPGGTYWFDLSGETIPGTVNTGNSDGAVSVPDTTLHYVPFTYAGTVEAYKLTSAMETTEEYAEQNTYSHSLFVADYAVTHTVSWDELNNAGLIFGKSYTGGSVDYTLRTPSVGSWYTGLGDSARGTPQSNEWDAVLDKNSGYIKNWNGMFSWGQDTISSYSVSRVLRGYGPARYWNGGYATYQHVTVGFRPVLEVLNTDALGSDGLKAVTLDLNGGKLGGSADDIQIIVKNGAAFTAPASDGLTAPQVGYSAQWQDSDGNLYAPGDSVPAGVTTLTAQWMPDTYTVTLHLNDGTIANGKNVTEYTYGTGATLPTADDITREGYTFEGWYEDNSFSGSPVTEISATDTGKKEFYAKWKDVTCPTGEITVDKSKWNTFFNNITFGLFFKDTQKVTITASDNSGEDVTIEYLLSDKALSETELVSATFTSYTDSFSINPDNKYVVYARLTDHAGNVTYISSNGIVLDATAPVITGIENGKVYCEAQTVTVTEDYIESVKVNGTAVTLDANNQFTLNPAEGTQTIVATDNAGNKKEMTVTVNNGHTYGTWQSNGDGTHTHYCTVDGCNGYEDGDCDGGEASYFNKAVCDTCQAEYGALLTDSTAPTGEISIGINKWNSFLNTITFGLFFKDTQSVTVTAADDSYSHDGYTEDKAVKVEYYLYSGDTALTEADLVNKEFTEYNGDFNINPDNKYVVYARLTDHAGNVTYISSEGVVLDVSAPVISGVENGKTYCEAQTVTVTEDYIESVKVNGTAVTLDANNQFTLNPAEGTQTIVVTDKAGNVSAEITVTVNDGHTYEWQSENGQYWKKCKYCDDETAKKDIPTITINGADAVCITQDYKFSFTLPEGATDAVYGYEFENKGDLGLPAIIENNEPHGVVSMEWYEPSENSFKIYAGAKTADGFEFFVSKTVALKSEHTFGDWVVTKEATVDEEGEQERTCSVCGETETQAIPKIDDTHTHTFGDWIVVKEATKDEEGEMKRVCSECGASETQTISKLPEIDYILGDVNGDGKSTAADARLALRASARLEVLDERQALAADVDGNGKVTAVDARKILRVSAHLDVFA